MEIVICKHVDTMASDVSHSQDNAVVVEMYVVLVPIIHICRACTLPSLPDPRSPISGRCMLTLPLVVAVS